MASRRLWAALAAAAALAAPGCGFKHEPIGSLPPFPQTVIDGLGRRVEVRRAPTRIASLDPGATETVFALGVGPAVVAASGDENYPPAARKLPVVHAAPGSAPPALRQAHPDLVIVPPTWSAPDAQGLSQALDAPVYVAGGTSVEGIEHDVAELGLATDRATRARAVLGDVRDRVASVRRALAGEPPVPVFVDKGFFFTIDPRSLSAELLRLAGGENIAPRASPGRAVPPRVLRRGAPRVYLAYTTGSTTLAGLRRSSSTRRLPAVRSGRFDEIEPEFLEDSGPRVGHAVQRLARLLHPGLDLRSG